MSSSTALPPSANDASSIANIPFIFTCVFIPVQIICVGIRYWSRWLVKSAWGVDDILVFISLIFQMGLAAITLDAIQHGGLGQHALYIEHHAPEELIIWLENLFAMSLVYLTAVNIPKFAILILYYRVFPTRIARTSICILFAVLAMCTVILVSFALAACRPISSNWNLTLAAKDCLNKEPFYLWASFPNFITDACMLALPLPIIWKLQTQTRSKIGLTLTFMVGSAGLITSIWRFNVFWHTNSFTDTTYAGATLVLWTQLEPGCYLISACMLTWHPLVDRFSNSQWVKRLTNLTTQRTKKSGGNSRGLEENDSDIRLRPLHSTAMYKSSIHGQGFVRLDNEIAKKQNILVTTDFVRGEEELEKGELERIPAV